MGVKERWEQLTASIQATAILDVKHHEVAGYIITEYMNATDKRKGKPPVRVMFMLKDDSGLIEESVDVPSTVCFSYQSAVRTLINRIRMPLAQRGLAVHESRPDNPSMMDIEDCFTGNKKYSVLPIIW